MHPEMQIGPANISLFSSAMQAILFKMVHTQALNFQRMMLLAQQQIKPTSPSEPPSFQQPLMFCPSSTIIPHWANLCHRR
jgi:hypothetical protein